MAGEDSQVVLAKVEMEKPPVETATSKDGNKKKKDEDRNEEKTGVLKAAEAQRIAEETAKAKAEQLAAEKKEKEEEIKALEEEGDKLCAFPPETIKMLSLGLNGLNAEALQHVAAVLRDLQHKQLALIEQLALEDRKVMTLPHMAEVAQALSHVPTYTKKLQDLRKDMDAISNRVKGMRKRAAKLYTKKQQEDNSAAQQRQMSLQAERQALAGAAEKEATTE